MRKNHNQKVATKKFKKWLKLECPENKVSFCKSQFYSKNLKNYSRKFDSICFSLIYATEDPDSYDYLLVITSNTIRVKHRQLKARWSVEEKKI